MQNPCITQIYLNLSFYPDQERQQVGKYLFWGLGIHLFAVIQVSVSECVKLLCSVISTKNSSLRENTFRTAWKGSTSMRSDWIDWSYTCKLLREMQLHSKSLGEKEGEKEEV